MRRSALVALIAVFGAGMILLRQPEPAHAQSATKGGAGAGFARAAGTPVTKEEVESFMRHTFGWNPDLKWEVASISPSDAAGVTEADISVTTPQGQQPLVLFITPDGQHAINGEMVPFGPDPYKATSDELKTRAKGPAKGPANAALTIVEFSDLQCPHCKAAQPVVEKLLGDNPNARFIFENFPLQMHDWAMKAASYGLCVQEQNPQAFWNFVQRVYDSQDSITAATADSTLTTIANGVGVNGQTAATCASKPEIKAKIDQSLELGKQVGVTGTPTLFLNGRKIQNISGTPYQVLSAIAKFQEGQGK